MVAGAVVLSAAGFFYFSVGRGSTSEVPDLETPTQPRREPLGDVASLENDTRTPILVDLPIEPLPVITQGQYLRDYWGARWPEVEEALLDADWDLLADYEQGAWPSWEDVEPFAVASMLNGTATLEAPADGDLSGLMETTGAIWLTPLMTRQDLRDHPDLNPEGKKISKFDYEQLKGIDSTYGDIMLPTVEAYLAANQSYRAMKLDQGLYEHGPFYTPQGSQDPNYHGRIESTSGTVNGWAYAIYIEVEKDPLMASLLAELELQQKAKQAELQEYIEYL
ncbi:MAG: hypothetical protein OSB10_00645 [Planctomycetota bacterium]|nr:hypothetical protein [Planctomycetota bacterium]